jgi:DNA helicase II / ATP-dependent DNA helicase PcrA
MTFVPTPEQEAIVNAARGTRENLIIEALAGAAKTSTLVLIAEALTMVPTLAIAFNKRIADEMARRLPPNVHSRTLNSVGMRAWSDYLGKGRLIVDKDKTYNLFKALIEDTPKPDRGELYAMQADVLKAVRLAKTWGWKPEKFFDGARTLMTDEDYWARLNEELEEDVPQGIVEDLLVAGIKQSHQNLIDFDDQIYMPTLFGGKWPQYALVMVDEAQDLSSINHAMLEHLVKHRLIAVGDPYQAIYGFRGAQADSMSVLAHRYNMTRLGLSVSFRCPRKVIERARSRAPHMMWPEWAEEGHVETFQRDWGASDIADGAAIICRNNAPLMHIALQLLKAGRGVQMVGMDLGPQLIKTLKKMGEPSDPRSKVEGAIEAWKMERLRKGKNAAAITDRAECLLVFARFGETLSQAVAYAEHIFAAHGPIQLLSGHKSKGLEWDTVYHLDPWKIPSPFAKDNPEALIQEHNVRYVIETRSKKALYLMNTDNYDGGGE